MSLIKSTLFAASFAVIGALSANAAHADTSYVEAMRAHEWSAKTAVSAEARRARASAVTTTRQAAAPFSRMSLENLTW